MASADPQFARYQGASVFAGLIDQRASPFLPQDPLCTAVFGTEHLEISPQSGQAIPGGVPAVFETTYEVAAIKSLSLHLRVGPGAIAPGGLGATATANNVGLVNGFGLAAIEEIELKFGQNKLTTMRPMEVLEKAQWHLSDEEYSTFSEMVGLGLDDFRRYQRFTAGDQLFTVPLLLLLGLHLGADLSQVLFQRMLSEKLRLTIKFAPVNKIFFANGTFSFPAGDPAAALPAAASVFKECYLLVEGVHVGDQEAKAMEQIYKMPRRYICREAQHCTPVRVPAATLLNGTFVDISMREINQPCVAVYVVMRWAADIDRVTGGTGATRGCRLFNTRGWYNPGGLTTARGQPIVASLEGRSGSNMRWLKKTPVQRLLEYERNRVYKGSGLRFDQYGMNKGAVPHICFSHDPTKENAVLGFMDFAQGDNPVLRVEFRVLPAVNNVTACANIGEAANEDIGQVSDLEILVIADTVKQITLANHGIASPLN